MLSATQNLPDEPAELKQLVGTLVSEVKSQALLIEKLRHQLASLRRHRFGSSSEALDQLVLTQSDLTSAGTIPSVRERFFKSWAMLFITGQ